MEKNGDEVEVGGRHKIDDVALIERRDREIYRLLDALMHEKRETARLRNALDAAYDDCINEVRKIKTDFFTDLGKHQKIVGSSLTVKDAMVAICEDIETVLNQRARRVRW